MSGSYPLHRTGTRLREVYQLVPDQVRSPNHPRSSDLLGGLTGLRMSILSYAQLGFAQGGDTKQNQPRRRYVGETWKKPGASFQEFSPVKSHGVCFILPVVTTPVKCGPLGSSLEMQCPGVLLVDCHAGMLCQAHTKMPESLKEGSCSSSTTLFIQTL